MLNINTAPDVLTVDELADLLRVERRTVINYIKAKKIPAVQVGKLYRIAKKNILFLFGGTI